MVPYLRCDKFKKNTQAKEFQFIQADKKNQAKASRLNRILYWLRIV